MCTRFTIPYKTEKDGIKHLVARTMDFASMTGGHYVKFPAGAKAMSYTTYDTKGSQDSVLDVYARCAEVTLAGRVFKYFISDAANAVFSMETLWLPETRYATASQIIGVPNDKRFDAMTLAQVIMSGKYKTLDDLAKALDSGYVLLEEQSLTEYMTAHMAVTEWKTGKTLIVEIGTEGVAGQIRLYRPEATGLGVMTNSPAYSAQWGNLRGYINLLEPANKMKADIGGVKDVPLTGNGNNLLGLPGSPLPSDRFVRTNILLTMALNKMGGAAKDKAAAIDLAAQLIGMVFVIEGTTSEPGTLVGTHKWDSTLWSVIKTCESGTPEYLHRVNAAEAFAALTPDVPPKSVDA